MQAWSTRGEGNLEYVTDVTVEFDDGSSTSYKESGTLENVAYTEAQVTHKQNNVEITPAGFAMGTTNAS